MVDEAGKAPSLLHRSPSPIETIIRAVEKRRWTALLLGLGSFAVIAVVDLLTPEEISFALFYFIPVGLLAAFLGGPWPWLAAAAGAFLWPVDHLVRGEMAYLHTTVAWWESSVRLGCYAAWIICLRLIRGYVDRQRQADRDLRGALAAVQESEGRYREVFEHSSNGILILDVLPGPRFRVAAMNPEVERITGIRAAQAIGRFVEELLKPSTAEMLTANYRQAVLQNTELEVEGTTELPSGWKDFRTTIIPLAGLDGRVSRLIALPTDVTEQNRVEAAMRESQQRYREVFENTSDGIFVLDVTPDRRFRVAAYNPTMERMTGFRNEEVAGKFNEEFLPPHTAAAVRANNERCLAAGAPISFDEELDLPRGHFWWHTTLVPVRGAGGEILRLIGVSSDVTETVRYQRALRQSEEKFSKAFHASPDSITLTRLSDGVLLEVNQGFLEAYGYERGEVIGRSSLPGVLGIWADAADRQRLTDQLREKGEVTGFEARMRRKGGEIRYCVLSSRVVEIGDERCILTISRDVTERRRMEEALRESEARYREVFENTSDGIFVLQVTPD
ncbi:MAG TPA: PAS domain S-box protein, partial [Spirochaetia bacterium]|nr:PAS domain S-box protein [Spirochaetia bacterium]